MKSTLYILQRNLVRLTWLAPATGYLIVVVALMPYSAPVPSMMPILGIGSLMIGAWVSVTTIDGDDPSQKSVVALASGGRLPARVGEVWASFLFIAPLSVVGLVIAFMRASPVPEADALPLLIGGGLVLLLSTTLLGVALGYLFAWPVVQRTPITLGVVFLVAVALIIVPVSPVSALLATAGEGFDGLSLASSALGTMAISAAGFGAGSVLVTRRWRLTSPR